jgi:glucose-1-phosphate thymidylyltransferase
MASSEKDERNAKPKGIIFAGDSGRRLHPLSQVIAKHLLPVYDKPLIYYPLSLLMHAGIREILLVATSRHLPCFMELLGNGSRLGITISYAEHAEDQGVGETFLNAERFIGRNAVCLIHGDTILHGRLDFLRDALQFNRGATIFVGDLRSTGQYPVIEFDRDGNPLRLGKKPGNVRGACAIAGLSVYDDQVGQIAKSIRSLSEDGFHTTDIECEYLRRRDLRVHRLGRDVTWLDAGSVSDLLTAGNLIATIETRQGLKTGCIEETAYRMGYIDAQRLERLIHDLPKGSYRDYLVRLLTAGSPDPKKKMPPPRPGETSHLIRAGA